MNKLSILAGGFLSMLLVGVTLAQAPPTTTPNPPQRKKGARNTDKMLRKQDANSDGKLARDEWQGKAQGFDRLDRDQDGFLTRAELARPGQSERGTLGKLDVDKDGQIARTEWKGNPRGFAKLDANGDGVLTTEELANRPRGKRGTPPPATGTPKPEI
jgi:hypothetical protein